MTKKPNPSLTLVLLLLLLFPQANATPGVCISGAAASLVPPDFIVSLLLLHGISTVRLFAPIPAVLAALKGTGIMAMVGVPKAQIIPLATGGVDAALGWLRTNVLAFVGANQINFLAVGNEVVHHDASIVSHLVPAMYNLHKALQTLGLDSAIKISSPLASKILGVSMPPSAGAFASSSLRAIQPMLKFLSETGAPLMVNMYPFHSFIQNPNNIPLSFFLCQGNAPPLVDSGLKYTNILDATVDALAAAMERVGFSGIPVTVTQTGWPAGVSNNAATPANAAAFVRGIIQRVLSGTGTPKRPNQEVQVFLSNLFDEAGKESGMNIGIFNLNGTNTLNVTFIRASTPVASPSA